MRETWPLPTGVWNRCQILAAPQEDTSFQCAYSKGALQGDLVPPDAFNGGIGDRSLAILEDWVDIDRLPDDRCLSRHVRTFPCDKPCTDARRAGDWETNVGGSEDVLHSDGNFGTNAVTLDQANGVAALQRGISCMVYYLMERLAEWWCLSDFHMSSRLFTVWHFSPSKKKKMAAYLRILLSVELGDTLLRRVQPPVL